ncbi:MAG: diguanylate cyclase [Alphaproteobacteria bacterium]|nr:diguanylate cyclase [Alphaproteobacteria bacterium]
MKKKPTSTSLRNSRTTSSFKSFFDSSVQGILIHHNFKPLYANKSFADLFGFSSAQDVLALPLIRPLIPDDLWPQMEIEYDEMIRGIKPPSIGRGRALRRDGQEFWISLARDIIDWNGQKAVMLSVYDISLQVDFEYNLLKSEQKLRSVLEILPYPIYIARKSDGHLLFVNRKSCLLFQRSAGQFLKMKAIDLYADPQDRLNLHKLFDTVSDIRDIEVRMKKAHGSVFIAEMAAILLDYNGAPAFLVALNDISQRKELENELFRQASTDSLTGINNRRHFQNLAEQEFRRARRFSRTLTAMMIDIDLFKPINDTFGHAAGDIIIKGVVKRALETLRQSDFIGRVGGEEFAVILPETTLSGAYDVAERLRKHIQEKSFVTSHIAISCTVSIGVAELANDDASIDDLIQRADAALYIAKKSGRNRVEISKKKES